jgi:hypothetical protein
VRQRVALAFLVLWLEITVMHPQRYTSDPALLGAWRQGIAESSKSLAMKRQLLHHEAELLPESTHAYQKLLTLPRHMRRSLQRRWKQSLAGIALLLALGQAPALAATINVGGTCTLGRAITSANNDASRFCMPGSGADTIVLSANSTQTLTTINNTVFGRSGLPVVRSSITIDGNHSTIRRASSSPSFRILTIVEGRLTLRETTVTGGKAVEGFGSYSGFGGGLFVYEGSVGLVRSTVTGNRAQGPGGGVQGFHGDLSMIASTISGNSAFGEGGGVSLYPNSGASITRSTISGNEARSNGGGGLSVGYSSTAFLTNSTVANNTADFGGGIGIGAAGSGSSVALVNSTLSGNAAAVDGGGIWHSIDAALTLTHTLISGNTAIRGAELCSTRYSYGVRAGDLNLIGHKGLTNARAFRNFTPGATDITATSDGNTRKALNAILNTNLNKNGGPTRTHALVAGSPAIDAINNGTCPPPVQDQRGILRPKDGNGDGGVACDIGSFERNP